MNEKMRCKIGEVDAYFNRPETIQERRSDLAERFGQHLETILFSAGEIKRQVSQVAADQLLCSQKPMVIVLKVEQGRVLEAYDLDER